MKIRGNSHRIFCPLTAVATDLHPSTYLGINDYHSAGVILDMSDSLIRDIVSAADWRFFVLLGMCRFRAAWIRFRFCLMRYI